MRYMLIYIISYLKLVGKQGQFTGKVMEGTGLLIIEGAFTLETFFLAN